MKESAEASKKFPNKRMFQVCIANLGWNPERQPYVPNPYKWIEKSTNGAPFLLYSLFFSKHQVMQQAQSHYNI